MSWIFWIFLVGRGKGGARFDVCLGKEGGEGKKKGEEGEDMER